MTNEASVAYADDFMTVHVEEIVGEGTAALFSTVTLGPGVTVVAMESNGTVYLVEEYRRAYGGLTLECVGGRVETEEASAHTARRELREETGIEAATWTPLGEFWPHTSKVVATSSLWLATDLTFGPASPEPGEHLRVVPTPLSLAIDLVRSNKIVHAPSALALLLALGVSQHLSGLHDLTGNASGPVTGSEPRPR